MSTNRNALLSDIQKGRKLKKAVTNDRSAPIIDGKKTSVGGRARSSSASEGSNIVSIKVGAPIPGGLFAGGMPKLKSRRGIDTGRENNNLATPPPLPGGRPRAPSDGNKTSIIDSIKQSKFEAPTLKGIAPSAVPNRTTPNPPSLPSRVKTSAVPPQIPNRTNTSNTSNTTNTTNTTPPLPLRSSKSVAPKKVPPTPPQKPSSLIHKPAPPPPARPASAIQQSHSPPPSQPLRTRSPNPEKQRPASSAVLPNGKTNRKEPSPSRSKSMSHTPNTEGRWTFRQSSDFPAPKPFIKSTKEYPSGASSGSPIPIQRAAPPPPRKVNVK